MYSGTLEWFTWTPLGLEDKNESNFIQSLGSVLEPFQGLASQPQILLFSALDPALSALDPALF